MSVEHSFLFALPGAKDTTSSTRKVHIRRLHDILQLSLQRNDIPRSKRAWAILARCKEVPWMEMWTTAVHILGDGIGEDENDPRLIEFLRAMLLHHPDAVSRIFNILSVGSQ
jgi:RNA polymerase I-specific transcription initiation factor RRN11